MRREREGPAARRSVRPSLILTCLAANLAEAGFVVVCHIGGGAAIAPQAAAPPPLGLFSDLRWLLVYERSWPTFALGAGLVVTVRSSLSALQARLAWPGSPPPLAQLLARSFIFTVLLGALLFPFALLLFALAAFPVSWLYFAAVPCALVISLLLHQGAFDTRWWRRVPAGLPLAWMAATLVVLMFCAGLVALDPGLLALPVAALGGWFEAHAWSHIVGALARARQGHFVPVAPSLLIVFIATAVFGAASGFQSARPHPDPASRPIASAPTLRTPRRGQQIVLTVAGFSSGSSGVATRPDGVPKRDLVVDFSYRGALSNGLPMPYGPEATHASLGHLARLMAAQIDRLAAESARPVDIVAVSEGSAVTEAYLSRASRPPVARVVLISPLLHLGSVRYPAPGSEGWGMVAGQGLDLLSSWLQPIATVDLSPEQPFLQSLVHSPPLLDRRPCPVAGCQVDVVEAVPLADAVTGSPSPGLFAQLVVFAGLHGNNFSSGSVRDLIANVLSGHAPPTDRDQRLLSQMIGALAAAWRVPSLNLTRL